MVITSRYGVQTSHRMGQNGSCTLAYDQTNYCMYALNPTQMLYLKHRRVIFAISERQMVLGEERGVVFDLFSDANVCETDT